MAEHAERPVDLHWLLSPPAPGEAHVHVALGEGVSLTPQVTAALEQLTQALYAEEVHGHALSAGCYPRCSDLANCGELRCRPLNNCLHLVAAPCATFMVCRIGAPQVFG